MITHIPGTDVPLKVYHPTGQRPPLQESEARQRRGLLAKVHIAKKDLGLRQDEYEMILASFKVGSAAELTIPQLERLIRYLRKLGWRPVRIRRRRANDDEIRCAPLRQRCVQVAKTLPDGERRLAGLALKICGVSSLSWCRDAAKLERLLAVLGNIRE